MSIETIKAKNLLEGNNCYECNFYYNFKCRIELDDNELPETLSCSKFLPKEIIDAEAAITKQASIAIKKDIDKMFIDSLKTGRE